MSRSEYDEHLPLFSPEDFGERRGSGVLSALISGNRTFCSLPLEMVSYEASAAEQAAQVTVTQCFRNNHNRHIEAVYTFPLSGNAAVSDFELHIGERVIKGSVMERKAAKKEYRKTLMEGKQAAVLEQERDELFTLQVGNIPPGESVLIRLTYSERLLFFEDGTTELRLPLVAAPRYIAGAPLLMPPSGSGSSEDTDIVPDASRIIPHYLPQGDSGGVKLSIMVTLYHSRFEESFIEHDDISCSQHAVQAEIEEVYTVITLAEASEIMDRDFVLRWKSGKISQRSSFWSYHDEETGENYGMVTLIPPHKKPTLRAPRDLVFMLDRSGSMEGIKMISAKNACSLLLSTLKPCDRFAILAFDETVAWMERNILYTGSRYFFKADSTGIEQSTKFLSRIQARGGTETYNALRSALDLLHEHSDQENGRVPVIVLITDGQSGDEMQILQCARQRIGKARLFTIGIDTAVNKGFLEHLARLGRGTSSCVEPGAALEQALLQISDEIGDAFVKDINISDMDSGLDMNSVTPFRISDLFAGRPSTIFFRTAREGAVILKGRYPEGTEYREVLECQPGGPPVLKHLWARSRISDLEDRYNETLDRKIHQDIVDIGEKYNVLSKFTAFVARDREVIVNTTGHLDQAPQPVCYPSGWAQPGGWSHSDGGGGGCIMVDLLPCERKKFGFGIGNLLHALFFLLSLPFLLLIELYHFIRKHSAKPCIPNLAKNAAKNVTKNATGRSRKGRGLPAAGQTNDIQTAHSCPPELLACSRARHREPGDTESIRLSRP
ncbi:MAG: VIT domain-containing protein [Vulcanimicrobiota bacterium]